MLEVLGSTLLSSLLGTAGRTSEEAMRELLDVQTGKRRILDVVLLVKDYNSIFDVIEHLAELATGSQAWGVARMWRLPQKGRLATILSLPMTTADPYEEFIRAIGLLDEQEVAVFLLGVGNLGTRAPNTPLELSHDRETALEIETLELLGALPSVLDLRNTELYPTLNADYADLVPEPFNTLEELELAWKSLALDLLSGTYPEVEFGWVRDRKWPTL